MPLRPQHQFSYATILRSLGFASATLLAACTYGNSGSTASTVYVATTPLGPARATGCGSNNDCGADQGGGLCVPKTLTKEQSEAAELLVRAMRLQKIIASVADTSSSAPVQVILQQVQEDIGTYAHMTHRDVAPGASTPGAPLTRDEMKQLQDAAWLQSGATQAEMSIRQLQHGLSSAPITTDAQTVRADILGDSAGVHLDKVIGDLQTFLRDIDVVVTPANTLADYREADGGALSLRSGAGAFAHYIGPLLESINDAVNSVKTLLDPSAISTRQDNVTSLSRGHGLIGKDNPGECLESL